MELDSVHEIFQDKRGNIIINVKGKTTIFIVYASKHSDTLEQLCYAINQISDLVYFHAPDFQPFSPAFKLQKTYHQIVVEIKKMHETLNESVKGSSKRVLSKRSLTTLRKNINECHSNLIPPSNLQDVNTVIEEWKNDRLKTGKSISGIWRDYHYLDFIEKKDHRVFGYLGYRNKFPISFALLTMTGGRNSILTLLGFKALNCIYRRSCATSTGVIVPVKKKFISSKKAKLKNIKRLVFSFFS